MVPGRKRVTGQKGFVLQVRVQTDKTLIAVFSIVTKVQLVPDKMDLRDDRDSVTSS